MKKWLCKLANNYLKKNEDIACEVLMEIFKEKCGDKIYSTDIKIKKNIAVCRITEGYRHQVRAHLAYSGYPICGDKLYNPNAKPDEKMQFEAFRFEFTDPKSLKNIFYEL